MNELEKRKESKKFNDWRRRTIKSLNPLLVKFFSNPYNYDEARKVGMLIEGLNDPTFAIMLDGKRLAENDVIGMRIVLEIEAEMFFKFMKKKFGSLK